MTALTAAFSWLTVLPVRGPETVDRALGARVIRLAPVVGILLGTAATGLLWALVTVGATPTLAGFLVVGALALVTRGMHLDGLADSADGLGSYGPPERAREIMKTGPVGPFGVAALVFTVAIPALAFAALAAEGRWLAVGLAVWAGRVAVVAGCRRGGTAAPGSGFGTLVAGTQSPIAVAGWVVLVTGAGAFAVPGRWWQGELVVLAALAAGLLVLRHCERRFGGGSGDVLGATLEITVAAAAVGFSLG